MQSSNQMRGGRSEKGMGVANKKISMTETPGTYDRNQSPTFSDHPRTGGLMPEKFAESSELGTAKKGSNQMRTAAPSSQRGKASEPKTSTAKKSSNQYRRATNSPVVGKKI